MNTPLRCSGMARVLKGSHSFTCTPCIHPLMEWVIPAFAEIRTWYFVTFQHPLIVVCRCVWQRHCWRPTKQNPSLQHTYTSEEMCRSSLSLWWYATFISDCSTNVTSLLSLHSGCFRCLSEVLYDTGYQTGHFTVNITALEHECQLQIMSNN